MIDTFRTVVLAIAILCTACRLASAQEPAGAASRDDSQHPWVVYRCDLNDYTGQRDWIVADFPTLSEAVNDAVRRNEAEPNSSWIHVSMERPRPSAIPSDSLPEYRTPVSPFVAAEQRQYKSTTTPRDMSGNYGNGKIGEDSVEFELRRGNVLAFTSGLSGEGKYQITAAGGIIVDTARSRMRGSVSGRTIAGIRFYRDNSEPPHSFVLKISGDLTIDDLPILDAVPESLPALSAPPAK